jgi:hypothetical protein
VDVLKAVESCPEIPDAMKTGIAAMLRTIPAPKAEGDAQ